MNIHTIKYTFSKFMNGIRVLMLINRSVQNSNKGSKRWINKIITKNEDEWLDACEKLISIQKYLGDSNIRLYSCVNERDLNKAISLFNHKQIDLIDDQKEKFYCNIHDSFSSCLMKPENKLTKYFLLDVDSLNTFEVDMFIINNSINVILCYPSKNGWHYIVSPFNIKLAEGCKTFEVKKDALLLINYIDKK